MIARGFAAPALILLLAVLPGTQALSAERFTAEEINSANFDGEVSDERNPVAMRLQVMLDRADFSPGVIDGFTGGNTDKALRAYARANDLGDDGVLTEELWSRLTQGDQEPAFTTHAITEEDLAEPFVESIPEDYAELAEMERLSYTGPEEMFAERFHMDIDLLRALNPEADFGRAGAEILVAAVKEDIADGEVARIVVSRGEASVRAFDADDNLIAFYTATIGSEQTPSPTGTHEVEAAVLMPNYTYRPDVNFKQGELDQNLILPPGPNNPVGSVWIDLSEPTYGIHGTPEPSKIDKTYSHGCVRMTNWDAEELAALVKVGSIVEFVD
ncbi:MAG TPA: L,D-transpeptidase [Saliniramus sp.]|nr:L,D-transpeptidase [Saliniramus sp.]